MAISNETKIRLRWALQNIEYADEIISIIEQVVLDDLQKLQKSNNLSDVQSVAQSRNNLGLGTAALSSSSDFDSFGSAIDAQNFAIQRNNHTGTQTSTTISDFNSAAALAAPIQSVSGKTGIVTLEKTDVGLFNVDNTSDIDKPVSIAQQTAINDAEDSANSYTDSEIAALIDSSPAVLDTLNELSQALGNDPNFATTVANQIGNIQSDIDNHIDDLNNPHSVTKNQIGLSNVDNTSDADKPISTLQQNALDEKIDLTEKGAANGVVETDASNIIKTTATGSAPSITGSVSLGLLVAIRGAYNGSTNRILAEPTAWLQINVGGTIYKVPMY